MNKDIRWHQRFENLDKALRQFNEALHGIAQEPNKYLYQIALIGIFQCTFALSWKTMKDYLIYNGIEISLPRDVLKQVFHHQLIQDGQVWIDMLEDRNLLAHAYQAQAAITAVKNIRARYAPAIEQTYRDLHNRRAS